jgi:beta-lactamase family protein
MRRSLILIITAVSLSATVLVHAADDLVLSRFSDFLDALREQSGIPGLAATIVSTNDIMWEHANGLRDVDRNLPVRTDTPFQIDGSAQLLVAAQVLRCAEEGRLLLDGRADSNGGDGATVRQLLTHTTSSADGLRFSYRLDGLAPLAAAIATCTGDTFSGATISMLERLNMTDTVPGSDGTSWLPASADPGGGVAQRYSSVLGRLATPYTVDGKSKPTPSRYSATTLTPSSISRSGEASSCVRKRSRWRGRHRTVPAASVFRMGWAGSCRATTGNRSSGSSASRTTDLRL